MSTLDERLLKLREERAARQKARIETLREINLKKYSKNDPQMDAPANEKRPKSNSISQIKNNNAVVKNNFHVNGTTKRPLTAPLHKNEVADVKKNFTKTTEPKSSRPVNYILKNIVASTSNVKNNQASSSGVSNIGSTSGKMVSKISVKNENKDPNAKKPTDSKIPYKINSNKNVHIKPFERKPVMDKIFAEIKPFKPIDPQLTRKSIAVDQPSRSIPASRKSMLPCRETSTESVFDRLYKPKMVPKKIDEVQKLHKDPAYLKKVIAKSGLITKRHTCFTMEPSIPVRRSISAIHFKRISKNELGNCVHKWSSIGDKLNQQHLTIDEEDGTKEDKITSAIKSERKKVTFMTPMSHLNTPRPDELQARLKAWLKKRGKSLHSYQHLQCFGMHQITHIKPMEMDDASKLYDEENKENIAVDSDTDDDSFTDISDGHKDTLPEVNKVDVSTWRPVNDSIHTEFNDTADESMVTSADTLVNVDELLNGALNDLTELLKEGFEWEQGARYLRAIRARFPSAPQTAGYWECRAALEESRGDLHRSVECWEQAIAKGTETKTAEASIDTLLNKFMQLKISPNSAVTKRPDPKMVDVKNVFKSTIIRFAMAQAKLKHSASPEFVVTPVRRSVRLSLSTPRVKTVSNKTPREKLPLRLYDSVKDIKIKHVFEPNLNIVATP